VIPDWKNEVTRFEKVCQANKFSPDLWGVAAPVYRWDRVNLFLLRTGSSPDRINLPAGWIGAFNLDLVDVFYPGMDHKESSRSMNHNSTIFETGDWVVRHRQPESPGPQRLILLLHGWTGDENSMWIFTPRLPEHYLIIAPRGITKTALGGYGWERAGSSGWSKAADFGDAIRGLFSLIESFERDGLIEDEIDLMGFSQGAALAYTMLLQYPERIGKLAGISGFLPAGLDDVLTRQSLVGKKVFVSHGTRDDMVSLDQARNAVRGLKSAGAEVIYCEEDVGHKLSAGCFRAMDDYFSNQP